MKFRVGACALLVCLAGCTAETPDTKFGDQRGAASASARTAQRLPSVQTGRQASQSVANAPDRGELVSYKNKGAAIKREGAYTWYPIAISEAHALKAVVDGVMSIPSPDGSEVKVRYERHVEHPDGNWTWIGRVIGGDQKQEAILTFGEKAVYGSIPQKTGAPLSLQTRGGQLYAVQTDLSKVKNPNSRTDMMVPPAQALRSTLLAQASKAQVSQSAVETKAATPASTVDVAIGYTAGFATAQGGQSAAVTRLVFLVEVGNQAFENSLITGAIRVVNALQIDYTDTTTNKAALAELTGRNENNGVVQIPASLVPLRTARDQYGADLAVLVRKFQTPENDGCGIAWLNGSGQLPIDPATDDDYGFAVISDGNDTGTDGNSYFCAPETLIHELGHLMGSAHDRDNSKKADGSQLFGRYPYSFGMKTTAANGNFYTIMAYGDNNQNFYRTFSNPLVLKCGPANNLSCGVADQTDNARSLNQTIPVVATFRATVVPIIGRAASDLDADGRSDIVLTHAGTGSIYYWLMDGAAQRSGRASSVTLPGYTMRNTGDFNADGRADLLLSNSTTVRLLLGRTDGDFTNSLVAELPAGWVVGGAGDIDADGKSDIVLTHAATGSVFYWLMDGAAQRSGRASAVTLPGYILRGVADFNADGRADLLFSNATSVRLLVGRADGDFTNSAVAELPAGWVVGGVGDVDADGKSDIVLTHAGTGSIYYWLMDGAGLRSGRASTVTLPGYLLRGTGDYNGDGRADLLFSNATTVRLLLGRADGDFTNSVVADLPPGWVVADVSNRRSGIKADIDADGKSDILLTHAGTGSIYYWLMDGAGQRSGRASTVVLPGFTLRGAGDFNADGRADFVYSNATTVRMLLGRTDGDFTNAVVAELPAGWTVGGIGDIDADGKSDIVLSHAATGSVYYWLMDGAGQRSGRASTVVLPGFTLRGAGDFNADGRADLVYTNATTVRMLVGRTDGDFTNAVVAELPPGWTVGGVGDIDADRKSDIILTHAATGSVYYWLMDGAGQRSGRASTVVLPGYTLRGAGDYNADGRADIVYSNGVTVRMLVGRTDGDFTNSLVADLPAGWAAGIF